jgi:serine/threonine protein kinase/Tol biopolymer transport system component
MARNMTLTSGTKLGPYEIHSPLGAGGMGEVYRARDTRLGRDVAIKVLPHSLAKDPDRLRRFEQEARTIAALNHPNILGIHDIGTHDGSPFLVSELLEGQSLRERLESGPISMRRTIEYALGIAQGLAAAHDKGIVHRDLKPDNIFITRDGRVKVLDFGLAKLVRDESPSDAAPTVADATSPGQVLGTFGYMSPEQVRGEAIGPRSDIFSFGAVLYEMLTGKRAFRRNTSAETMTAILRDEPPELTDTGVQAPPALQRILSRCLEKNVERRFQSASDLAFALESLSGTSSTAASATKVAPVKPQRAWLPWAAAAAAMAVLGAGLWFAGRVSASHPQPRFTRLTYQQGYIDNARFARDGQTVVYSAQWNNDPLQVYTVRLEFPQSTKVGLPSAGLLTLSASGDMEISLAPAYESNFITGTMAHAQMAGGTPRIRTADVIAADYAPDGQTLAVVRKQAGKVQLEYPAGKVLETTSGYLDYVRVSPSGKEVALVEHPVYGDDRGWVALIDSAGKHTQLTREYASVQGLVWSRNGKEIWFTASPSSTDRSVFAVSLSGKLREVFNAPHGVRIFDIAADGRVLASAEEYRTEINGTDAATGKERHDLGWFDGSSYPDIAPDGKAFAFMEYGGPAGPLYLIVYRKLDGSAPVALGDGAEPKFSPDGSVVATPILSRPPMVGLHPIGAGESRKLSLAGIVSLLDVAWFPDGKHLLLNAATEGQPLRSYQIDLEGGMPQTIGPQDFRGLAVSPDGKRIAGWDNANQAVVFDRDTQKVSVVPGIAPGDRFRRWTVDGKALLVSSGTPFSARMNRVETATGKHTLLQSVELSEKAGSRANLFLSYAEANKACVYSNLRVLGSLYVIEGLE